MHSPIQFHACFVLTNLDELCKTKQKSNGSNLVKPKYRGWKFHFGYQVIGIVYG